MFLHFILWHNILINLLNVYTLYNNNVLLLTLCHKFKFILFKYLFLFNQSKL